MITEEEYQKALAICDRYEQEQKAQYEDLDEDEDEYDLFPKECDDCGRTNCVCYEASNCHCGAWIMGPNGFKHVADCCC